MNILTIDLDFLLPQLSDFPFIEFNKSTTSPEEYWNSFKSTYDVNFTPNSSAYYFVTHIIRLIQQSKDRCNGKVSLIENHQDILKMIGDEQVHVTNIDHHHDIYYDYQGRNVAGNNAATDKMESCWVYHLYVKNQLTSYKWVANSNSKFDTELLRYPFSFHIEDPNLYEDTFRIDSELTQNIYSGFYDKIVFVESPYYLPKTQLIVNLINDIQQLCLN